MKRLSFIVALLCSLSFSSSAWSQADVVAQICSSTGVCAPVDPLTALAIVGVKVLADELNKGDKGFGPNGAVVKAVNTALNDLKNGGLGPNNELVKAFETIKNDLAHGPGKNNDIVKALAQIGVKL